MKKNLTRKIIEKHLLEGSLTAGRPWRTSLASLRSGPPAGGEIGIRIDQTLTQDATGTLAYLEFEAMVSPLADTPKGVSCDTQAGGGMGAGKIKTNRSVSYVDHNTLQSGFENADDHKYLQSIAEKYGLYFSPNGNGVCHQIHLERFSKPGETLIGSDSHTPTSGAMGMLAIGVGGLDVAYAMSTGKFYFTMPKIINIKLSGKLTGWASAKDVILELLGRLSVKGGVGKIFEYTGEGAGSLSVYERATVTNMGAEMGLTTSIFPSDSQAKKFLKLQNRQKEWKEISADTGAEYDGVIEINLEKIVPLVACPHSPDNVKKVKEIEGTKLDQIIIGSCTNSSLSDLLLVSKILKGKKVKVPTVISPGSKQVLANLIKLGALSDILASGVRILEPACGPCIGMGCAPNSGGSSLRTFNRNFKGRSGTDDAQIYISGPAVAAFSALAGKITAPFGKIPKIKLPGKIVMAEDLIMHPVKNKKDILVHRGRNIKPLRQLSCGVSLSGSISGEVIIKLKDNITTDDIIPAGAKILPLRSNIPAISEYVFSKIDPGFVERAKKIIPPPVSTAKQSFRLQTGGGIIVAGENYGQGSSREHAALCPGYLGIKAILAKSFARIHKSNLINFGIFPLIFKDVSDYEKISVSDNLEIENAGDIASKKQLTVRNTAKNTSFTVTHDLTERQVKILLAGGLLNFR